MLKNKGTDIERKDASGDNSADVKGAIEKFQKDWHDFKETNDRRIKEIEKRGAADPLLENKLAKLNERMDARFDEQKQLIEAEKKKREEIETALKRRALSSEDEAEKKLVAEAIDFARKMFGQKVKAEDVDVEKYKAYKSALNSYIRRNNAMGTIEEIKALSVGSDPDGGYWVTPDMGGRIAQLVYETSPMRQVANVVTIGTDALEGVNDLDEATVGWVGETTARTETDTPQIGEWRIPVHEQYAEPRATQKLLDDASFDVEAWLAAKVADKLARAENTAFITGNGVKKPRGILTYSPGTPSASTWNVVERVVTGASGGFIDPTTTGSGPGDCLISLVFALKNAYRQGASFLMRRTTLAAVRKLKDTQGQYLWQPDFQQKQGGLLLGYPIVEAEDMPAIAADSLSIAFGDFNAAYQIVDRQGVRILRDSFTSKPYVKFYTTKRVGGDVVNFEAYKLLKFATS